MMCLLNTQISQIVANRRLSLCLTPDGRLFAIGKDFRVLFDGSSTEVEDRNMGVPRPLLDTKAVIEQMTLGKDHAVLLSKTGQVYCFGSN